ncbi:MULTISPECIES: GntP family permease [Streptomyces]|uniref:GntP family permease n=2 Tax=Streptomyces TaxID=1883 RepID=A0A3R7IQP4_9ACTN|nr:MULTISPECIES: GntP family permease [Streptomyces]KNE83762.1 permease [Streptomyces fradiae]OFA51027.1 permease [Streptomyces fradiae]PQM19957.1 GntP family permease [Streptomyces xinghaiensis]RKM94041.1 GntP family permease [Streptomyces xinghaiensis]RNC69248.1 GntP family permease [Streptomyces xinghaiensis]
MEAIDPAYGTATLLLIAAGAVALLLFLIMKVKLHAFVALVLVSVLTALVVGFPLADIPAAMMFGFSSTLGSVALLVAFGVMLGRLMEVTGGAQVLADTLIGRFGEKRAPLALGVAALLFGFPIFFDAGLVVFLPIILTVARRFGGSLLLYALPAAGAFAAMHAIVPPHPGPVAAAEALGGSVGVILLVGIPVAVASWYVGVLLVSRYLGARIDVSVPVALFGEVNDGRGQIARDGEGETGDSTGSGAAARMDRKPPSFRTVLLLLLVPLVLISFDTVLDTLTVTGVLEEGESWAAFLSLLGHTPVALLITVLVAIAVLGRPRARMTEVTKILDDALGPICSIILITGAGGMFGGVLRLSGIGDALSGSLADLGISLIVQAFVIATLLRVAQGSATVALTTTAGLIAGAVAEAGLGDFQTALIVIAIAAGATVLSHVNDSGFWLVSRFFGMDERTTLKTWTVMVTTLGLSAFVIALGFWMVV